MFDSVLSLVAFALLGLAAFGLGRPLLRGLRVGDEDLLSTAVWSLALGLIAYGLTLTALGLAGWLYRPLIGVLTLAAGFRGVGELFKTHQQKSLSTLPQGSPGRLAGAYRMPDGSQATDDRADQATAPHDDHVTGSGQQPAPWLSYGIGTLCSVALLASLLAALAPPTAGDALCYHLELPKVFLAEHSLSFLPDHDNSTFPLLAEMWFLGALALDGGVAAQLVHWGLGLLLCLATVLLATPILGRSWAWVAGAVVLLTPAITNQMTAPLNDVALALFTTLALAAVTRPLLFGESPRWYLLAGLMLGGALGIKYVGLVFAAALAVLLGWRLACDAQRRRSLLLGAAALGVIAVSTSGVWYTRAAWHRGNPVYPFFNQHLGAAGPESLPTSKTPLSWDVRDMASAPWRLTMQPTRFGGQGHQFGPLFLAVLPGLFAARRLRGLGTLLAFAILYGLLWYGLRQNLRFLLPIVPCLAIGVAWVWFELGRFPRLPRIAAAMVFVGLAMLGTAAPVFRARDKAAVAVGLESREEYLFRAEPTYPAAWLAQQLLGPHDHLLTQDYRAFYFPGRVTRESLYRRRTSYDHSIHQPRQLNNRLRCAGFTHLLLTEATSTSGILFDQTLTQLTEAQMAAEQDLEPAAKSFLRLAEYSCHDSDGAQRRYRLFKLR